MTQRIIFTLNQKLENEQDNKNILFGLCLVKDDILIGHIGKDICSKSIKYIRDIIRMLIPKNKYIINILGICDDNKSFSNSDFIDVFFDIDNLQIKFSNVKLNPLKIQKLIAKLNLKIKQYDWINYYPDEVEEQEYAEEFGKEKIKNSEYKISQIENLIYYIKKNKNMDNNYDKLKKLYYNHVTQFLRTIKYKYNLKYNPECTSISADSNDNINDEQYEEKYLEISNEKGKIVGKYYQRNLFEDCEYVLYLKGIDKDIFEDEILEEIECFIDWDFFE